MEKLIHLDKVQSKHSGAVTLSVSIIWSCRISCVSFSAFRIYHLCFYFYFFTAFLSLARSLCERQARQHFGTITHIHIHMHTHAHKFITTSYFPTLLFILYFNFIPSLANKHTHTHTHKCFHHIRTSLWRCPHNSLPVRPDSREWVRREVE